MEKDNLEIQLEDIRGKFDLVLEGHDVLHKEIETDIWSHLPSMTRK